MVSKLFMLSKGTKGASAAVGRRLDRIADDPIGASGRMAQTPTQYWSVEGRCRRRVISIPHGNRRAVVERHGDRTVAHFLTGMGVEDLGAEDDAVAQREAALQGTGARARQSPCRSGSPGCPPERPWPPLPRRRARRFPRSGSSPGPGPRALPGCAYSWPPSCCSDALVRRRSDQSSVTRIDIRIAASRCRGGRRGR